jgi:hypothetical protein
MPRTRPRYEETLADVIDDCELIREVYYGQDSEAVASGLLIGAFNVLPAHWSLEKKSDWLVTVVQMTGGLVPKLAVN